MEREVQIIQIIDFSHAHMEQAARIAKINYDEARGHVRALPPIDKTLDLAPFAGNGLGVAAVDASGALLGFLCGCTPWDNAHGIPGLRQVFSSMGANGTACENHAQILARMVQAAGAKWARVGAESHAICLYAHDAEGQAQLFRYGFGMRTMDAIRGMEEVHAPSCEGYSFCELTPEDVIEVLPLENRLYDGLIESPLFMHRAQGSAAAFLRGYERFQSVYIVARQEGRIVAFIRAEHDGETFIQDTPGYLHCKGLYCLPEHRGMGISQRLLSLLVQKTKTQGCALLGVDFESFNPSGSAFWLKYFDAYTHGFVRRIDESALSKIRRPHAAD